jgi:hypothetical protein
MQTIMGNCEKDDVSGVAECLDFASSSGTKTWVQRLLPRCLRRAAMYGSPEVISHLIERGADVTEICGGLLSVTRTSSTRETLEALVTNGWEINRSWGDRATLVLWEDCLSHSRRCKRVNLALARPGW